jgi:hypothetical protein
MQRLNSTLETFSTMILVCKTNAAIMAGIRKTNDIGAL